VIIMTGYGSIEGAVDYLHRGADDYLTKPLTKEVFIHRLGAGDGAGVAHQGGRAAEELDAAQSPIEQLLGRSPKMVELKNQLPTFAQTEASVVIYGESGTGKEVVARTIHALSRRAADRPFVTVNCGALPGEPCWSRSSSATGVAPSPTPTPTPPAWWTRPTPARCSSTRSAKSRSGVQVKLLRFLELKEYKPVGSPKSRIADVRIIAATNRDLKKSVIDRSFREDLYYRLNVVPVHLASLQERPGDIAILATHFLERFSRQFNKEVTLSSEGLRKLESHLWPGNIRELENKLEQVVVMHRGGEIRVEDIPLGAPNDTLSPSRGEGPLGSFKEEKDEVIKRFERQYLTTLLTEEKGHVSNAAKRAGLDRKNLWQLMKRHRLDADAFKRSGGPATGD
jgi:two-component system response regulator GlrR